MPRPSRRTSPPACIEHAYRLYHPAKGAGKQGSPSNSVPLASHDRVPGFTPLPFSLSLDLFCGAVVTSALFKPECLPSLTSVAHERGGAASRATTLLVVPAGVIFAFLGFAIRIREMILLPSGPSGGIVEALMTLAVALLLTGSPNLERLSVSETLSGIVEKHRVCFALAPRRTWYRYPLVHHSHAHCVFPSRRPVVAPRLDSQSWRSRTLLSPH